MFAGVAIFVDQSLQSNVLEFNILQVGTNHDTEVHGTQIDIWLMLHMTLLGIAWQGSDEEYRQKEISISVHIKNNVYKGLFIISTSYKLLKYLPKSGYISKNIPIFASSKLSN